MTPHCLKLEHLVQMQEYVGRYTTVYFVYIESSVKKSLFDSWILKFSSQVFSLEVTRILLSHAVVEYDLSY